MKLNKFIKVSIVSLSILSASSTLVYGTTVADFKDSVSVHWGASVIQWGLDKDMVGGYPDGTFRPDEAVKEGEFAAMLARYADNTDKTFFGAGVTSGHWSQEYYNSLIDFKLPFNGYFDETGNVKNATVSRVKVAQIFAAKYGFYLGDQQAVYFLYENGLSQGRTAMNYEGYAPNEYLTRAEIIQFFKNVDNQGTKTLTFLGKQSTKGACDASTIVGIEGVAFDNTPVDFTQWVPAVSTAGKISTKVGPDGKVIAVMEKITTPVKVEGNRGTFINYFEYGKQTNSGPLNNSIALYNGVELPYGNGFMFPEKMMVTDENNGTSTGIIGIALDGNALAQVASFNDKESFKALLSNLKYFSASDKQTERARQLIDEWAGKHDERDNAHYYTLRSTIKDSAMLVVVGNGNVSVQMYSDAESVYLGTIEIVD